MRETVLMIGFGAIGLEVARRLTGDSAARLHQIMVRPGREESVRDQVNGAIQVISSLEDIDPLPDFVLECASHEAVTEYGPYFLEKGIDFGVVSIGAFSNPDVYDRLAASSRSGGAQLCILPGAVGGMDALSAARAEGLDDVTYISRKPPLSWKGTRAEELCDLESITEAAVIYEGTAREAAKLFPKNANVAATIALAGLGFDKTNVTLIADPDAKGNIHHIEARGAFGEMSVRIVGKPLPDNPKTSALTALSAIRAVENRARHVRM
ncbi:MAG: aspartate dehydrogenase [Rhodospirillales bacterium]|nr:aspartate dehydrogenase [Rhodospirillales bacterium]